MSTRKPKAVIFVSGGVVQDITMNSPNMEVIVVDFDTEGCDLKGTKIDRDGERCFFGVYSGETHLCPEEVSYWKKKDRKGIK